MSHFPNVGKIQYEGPSSKNPLAFRHYNPEEVVEGKKMKDLLRFTVCYWHTFRGTGSDPFGPGTLLRPWDDGTDSVENAVKRVDAAFEFIEKLGCPFYAFHDRDVAPEGKTLAEALMAPTRIYVKSLLPLLQSGRVKGGAHITGGGLIENPPRAIAEGLVPRFDWNAWTLPPVFNWLQQTGGVAEHEVQVGGRHVCGVR